MPYRRNIIYLCLTLSFLLLLSACNTMEGVGEDVQKAGQWIEEKAKK